MKKKIVLDTNIIMHDPEAIFGFKDNEVIITETTLQELDGLKTSPGETGYRAREAIRIINELGNKGKYGAGIPTGTGGCFRIWLNAKDSWNLPDEYAKERPDNRIINAALNIWSKGEGPVILVTNDISMQINASIIFEKHSTNDLFVQDYKNSLMPEKALEYTGIIELNVPAEILTKLRRGELKADIMNLPKNLEENQYIVFHAHDNHENILLARYRNGTVKECSKALQSPYGIHAKNITQRAALDALMAPACRENETDAEIPLVILKGPAGTAKTFLSLAAALEQIYEKDNYAKIMISRTNVLSDNDHGALPGDISDKMSPLVAPFFDNLECLMWNKDGESEEDIQFRIEDMMNTGILEIGCIAYMRGRSISNTFLIIDEAQNATPGQILEIITRAGNGTKIVLCGDPDQIDNPKLNKRNNGLVFAAEHMKGSSLCAQITFGKQDTVRSALATEAAKRLKIV